MNSKRVLVLGTLTGITCIVVAMGAPSQATKATAQAGDAPVPLEAVTVTVRTGARQTFMGLGASTGNWDGEYQSLSGEQRTRLSKMFWRDLNFKIFRLWFNVDDYSSRKGVHDLSLFRKQYISSREISDAQANGVTTLLLAPDHIPPYMRTNAKVDGPINDADIENFTTLIAEGIRQLRDEDGIRIQATGLENEPDMTTEQIVRGVKRLRRELDKRGLQTVQIIASEASSVDDRFYSQLDALKADKLAWDDLNGIASHSYNMAATDKAAAYISDSAGRNAKEYWMTEASDNGPEEEGMTGIPAIRAASLSARFLSDMNHRVTHWVHFLGLESTKPPYSDDATRIIAFEAAPFRIKVLKKYYIYQQLGNTFEPGAVFRDSESSLDGDMTWTYGRKPHLIAATALNTDGSWGVGITNFTADSFLKVQGWSDDKWNVEQGGPTPGFTYNVTVRIEELKTKAEVAFEVHRTNSTLKNAKAEKVMMHYGEVTVAAAPQELVTLRSVGK